MENEAQFKGKINTKNKSKHKEVPKIAVLIGSRIKFSFNR